MISSVCYGSTRHVSLFIVSTTDTKSSRVSYFDLLKFQIEALDCNILYETTWGKVTELSASHSSSTPKDSLHMVHVQASIFSEG